MATAALLLAIVTAELGDASCDPLPTPSATLTVTGPQQAGAEACRDGCVPDCYCCSLPLPAARTSPLEDPGPVAGSIFIHPLELREEISTVIDHVPLTVL